MLHVAESGAGFEPLAEELPLYGNANEPPEALETMRFGSTEGTLWAAAGKSVGTGGLTEEQEGQVTVLTRLNGIWAQVLGGGTEGTPPRPLPDLFEDPQEEQELLGGPARDAQVRAIAPEPGSEDAWLALAKHGSGPASSAVLVHISAQGQVLGVQTLPSAAERQLPSNASGPVQRLVCPALEDCWMANTNGWIYHLSRDGESQPVSELPGFPVGKILSERPPDEGIPQEVVDAPPPDTSGLQEEIIEEQVLESEKHKPENVVTLPLLSRERSRIVHGSVLQLSFHLSVKARVQLLAKHRKRVIAKTTAQVMKAGNRSLRLRLNPRNWPTSLALRTHALAPLKVVSSVGGPGSNVGTVSTGEFILPSTALLRDLGRLQ